MLTINELQDKWNSVSPYTGGYLLASDEHPLSFHIGYQNDQQKSFVVLNTGMLDHVVSSKAITAECIQTEDQTYALRFLLNYPSLDELFVKLCWDLMVASRYDECPVLKILDQYNKWLKLLQQAGNGILSSSLQKGLLGELLYFRDMLKTYTAENVLNAWIGPEGSDQDFAFPDHWAEVKAVSISAEEAQISSLQQLDRTDVGFLIVFFLDKTTSKGAQTLSLPEMIAFLRMGFTSARESDGFSCKLAQYGYFDKDAEKYAEIRYRFAEKRVYQVDDNFPRMTSASVPSAVISAHYGLSIAAIENNRVQEV